MSYLEPDEDDATSRGFRMWRAINFWTGIVGIILIALGLLTGHLHI